MDIGKINFYLDARIVFNISDFRLLGSEKLRCNANGEWEPTKGDLDFPVCEREPCEEPKSIMNGKHTISKEGHKTGE